MYKFKEGEIYKCVRSLDEYVFKVDKHYPVRINSSNKPCLYSEDEDSFTDFCLNRFTDYWFKFEKVEKGYGEGKKMINFTDEELLVLIALLGAQDNTSINEAIDNLDDEFFYSKGVFFIKPFMNGMKTPADNVYNRLLHESNKRGILKWEEDEWL